MNRVIDRDIIDGDIGSERGDWRRPEKSILSTLWSLMRYRPLLFGLNVLAWGVFHSIPLVTAMLIGAIFDSLAGDASVGFNIWTLLALMVGVSIARVSVMVGGVWSWSTAYYTLIALVRRNLFDGIVNGPGVRTLPDSPGEAVTRFRDDAHEVLMSLENITDSAGIFLMIVGSIFVMASIDPTVTAVAMIPLVGVMLVAWGAGRKIQENRRLLLESTGRITSFVGEVFGSVQAVKVATAEKNVVGHFERLNESRHDAAVRDVLFNSLFRAVNTNMAFIGMGIVMVMVAGKMRAGTFNLGDFALFVFFLQHLGWNMFFVGEVLAQYKRSTVSLGRLGELIPEAPLSRVVAHRPLYMKSDPPQVAIPDKERDDRLDRLVVRDLTARYPSSGRGIDGVDFEIGRGEFVVVTGRIGSGKSTLLKALVGLVESERGAIFWNGDRVGDPALELVPPRVAYIPQTPRLFSDQLVDNILMGQVDDGDRVGTAVNTSVLEPDVATLEDGLATRVGPRGVKLSGGQVQRSAAARAFVREAELLVIDDLSSALDGETEELLWQRLFSRHDVACLVATHSPTAIERADRVIVLDEGRVVSGTSA